MLDAEKKDAQTTWQVKELHQVDGYAPGWTTTWTNVKELNAGDAVDSRDECDSEAEGIEARSLLLPRAVRL
jgi:hypothetical protein